VIRHARLCSIGMQASLVESTTTPDRGSSTPVPRAVERAG